MLTWVRTRRTPERWNLGILSANTGLEKLVAIRAEVGKLDTGEWFWERWENGRLAKLFGRYHRCGDEGTRREAMHRAAMDLETCMRAPAPRDARTDYSSAAQGGWGKVV